MTRVNSTAPKPYPYEEIMQTNLFNKIREHEEEFPDLKFCTHVPNGGWRGYSTGAKLKAAGVRPGVPDILCFKTQGAFTGLAIELKCNKNKTKKEQDAWLFYLQEHNWATFTIWDNWKTAWTVIKAYMGITIDEVLD